VLQASIYLSNENPSLFTVNYSMDNVCEHFDVPIFDSKFESLSYRTSQLA